jgi:adenylosuccinate synthase
LASVPIHGQLYRLLANTHSIVVQVNQTNMPVHVVCGAQWGDEGKGKLVDLIAQKHDICARYNGGANAGHTIVLHDKKFKTNLLPSGVISPHCINVIGNGVVLDVPKLFDELDTLKKDGLDADNRVLVSDRCHLVFDLHKLIDEAQEKALGENSLGTTKKGIGPTYATKVTRSGVRAGDLLHWDYFVSKFRTLVEQQTKMYGLEYDIEKELKLYKDVYAPRLAPMIIDNVSYLHKAIRENKSILLEGANAVMLDIDFGTYPYVTSSNPSVGGACIGLGIPPQSINDIYAVVKAYCTRVGSGPFPTELENETGEKMRKIGGEFGTTTGRPRRCGWLDAVAVRYANMISGFTSICLTKLDVLDTFDEIKVATKYFVEGKEIDTVPASLDVLGKVVVEYETFPGWNTDISKCRTFDDLPENARKYVLRVEELLGVHIRWIGVGAGREAIIERKK